VHALKGKFLHFHPAIGEAKPFPGQIHIARRLTDILQVEANNGDLESQARETLQDPYSVRCAPQIAGVLYDALTWIRQWVETEANSSNDNPIFDPQTGQPLMSGNFYGGHMAFAMDALKAALASVADMSDRQMALLVDPLLNRGLPADLVRVTGEESVFHYGFKAMSLSTSALAAEALKLTMPAASFSRSTESHNQDKVSMGTIAARDAERVCTLTERVLAIHLLAAVQGCEIRGNLDARPPLIGLVEKVRSLSAALLEDVRWTKILSVLPEPSRIKYLRDKYDTRELNRFITRQLNISIVMPDLISLPRTLIRGHPVLSRISSFAGNYHALE